MVPGGVDIRAPRIIPGAHRSASRSAVSACSSAGSSPTFPGAVVSKSLFTGANACKSEGCHKAHCNRYTFHQRRNPKHQIGCSPHPTLRSIHRSDRTSIIGSLSIFNRVALRINEAGGAYLYAYEVAPRIWTVWRRSLIFPGHLTKIARDNYSLKPIFPIWRSFREPASDIRKKWLPNSEA